MIVSLVFTIYEFFVISNDDTTYHYEELIIRGIIYIIISIPTLGIMGVQGFVNGILECIIGLMLIIVYIYNKLINNKGQGNNNNNQQQQNNNNNQPDDFPIP